MRPDPPTRYRPLAAALLLAAFACERGGDETPTAVELDPRAGRDELIQLTLKRLPRDAATVRAEGDRPRTTGIERSAGAPSTAVDREAEHVEPGEDWATETLSTLSTMQLTRIAGAVDVSSLEELVDEEFRCGALRPSPLRVTFERPPFTVRRAESLSTADDDVGGRGGASFRGPAGLAEALALLRAGLLAAEVETHVKTIGVEVTAGDGSAFTTRVLIEVAGPFEGARGARQANATWTCAWRRAPPTADGAEHEQSLPRLLGIQLEEYAEASFAGHDEAAQTLFADVTASAFGEVPSFAAEELRSIEEWSLVVTRLGDMSISGHHGLAVGDADGDGLDDLFVCDGGSLPNRLYLQNPDGTVRDASEESGVDWLEDSRSALLVDLDGDGDQDLVVATIAVIAFAENDGSGKFSLRGGHRGAPYPFGLSAADYDLDGDLDVYVCVYAGNPDASGRRGFEARAPVPFHDARNGGCNVFLENHGAFRFADATAEVNLGEGNDRWSFAAAWEDYDLDGDPDLYVANDFGRNNLYRNDAGAGGRRVFVDVAATAGVEDIAAGMSVAWGDYNRDGRMDLHVGNMFSSAGNRVAFQRHFPATDAGAASSLRRMARGNSLFAAADDAATFADVSVAAGVTMGRWAWSSGFADLNNDGWEDIVVANGYLTNRREDDL